MPKFLSTLKAKVLAALSLGAIAATNAAAEITMSSQGVVSGNLELGTFYGLAVAVCVALAAIWAVKAGLRLIKG